MQDWTQQTSGTSEDLKSVIYSEVSDLFITVGEAGVILVSSDSEVWTLQTSEIVNNLIETAISNIPNIVKMLGNLILKLIDNLIPILERTVPVLFNVLENMVGSIMERLPQLIKLVVEFLSNMIQKIVKVLPSLLKKILPNLLKAVLQLVKSLLKELPKIIKAIIDASSFVFAKGSVIDGQTIGVLDSNGDLVEGEYAVGTTASASPTIVFTPSADAETPASAFVTSGLKDSFGVGATPVIDTSL